VRKPRRWHRLVIPFAVVLTLIGGTIAIRVLSEPDYGDPHYLSPSTAGDTSSVRLAELLRGKGITIQRETNSPAALTSAWSKGGQVTLFVPAPEFMHPDYRWMLRQSPAGTRVVLVEPDGAALDDAVPKAAVADRRWATRSAAPGPDCPLTTAGQASVTRTRYAEWLAPKEEPIGTYCYDHGLMSIEFGEVEFVLAGSPEPFRGDRMNEYDNEKLAVDLLSTKPTLIWLDLHAGEPGPKTYSEQKPPANATPIPSFAPGDERHRPDASPTPRESISPRPQSTRSAPVPQPIAQDSEDPFPPWRWPLILLLLLAVLAIAMARGRRLGPPVTEPLPVEVRGAETAIGRARLYRRAKARGPALETLRIEARRRIGNTLRLGVNVPREQLLDVLAARLGQRRELFEDILFGPEPESDAELETRTTELLLLVEQVTRNGKENPQ
jgi:hypothetical protein